MASKQTIRSVQFSMDKQFAIWPIIQISFPSTWEAAGLVYLENALKEDGRIAKLLPIGDF